MLTTLSASFLVGPAPAAGAANPITEYSVGSATDNPEGLAMGGDGNLWVAERSGNRIDEVTPTGAVTKFVLPKSNSAPERIVAGPDGALWFTEDNTGKIGRITTAGAITEYAIPTNSSGPLGITVGSDGALWFTEQSSSKIGRVTTAGAFSEYKLSTGVAPAEITPGPDGNLYFTERSGNRVGKITTAGSIQEYVPVPTAAGGLGGITTGPDGALWFTERNADKVGRITTAGAVTEYPVAISGTKTGPTLIVNGNDGGLWVTANSASALLRVATDGTFQTFTTPTAASGPYGVTVGPAKDVWFTENLTGKVGRISPATKNPSATNLAFTVQPAASAAGHEVTPATSVAPSTLGNTALLQAAPLGSSPLGSSPLGSSPLGSSPLGSSPLGSSPLGSSPLGSSALAPVLLSAIPLGSSPLGSSGWYDVLAGTQYANVPLQSITLGDVFALAAQNSTVMQRLNSLTLANVPLGSSPLGSSSVSSLLLGNVPLANLPAPSGGWCAYLSGQPSNCNNGVTTGSTTLLDLEAKGDDLSSYYGQQIDLSQVVLSTSTYTAPLAYVRLVNLALSQTPLGAVPTAQALSLLTCTTTCASTLAGAEAANQVKSAATVADALALSAVQSLHLGLGALIAGMIPPWQLPYESPSLMSDILSHALIRGNDLLAYSAVFDLDCSQASGLQVAFQLGNGFRVRPGTSTLTIGSSPATSLPEPTVSGSTMTYSIPTGSTGQPCAGTPTGTTHLGVAMQAEPSAVMGAYPATTTVTTALDRTANLVATAPSVTATADDSHDQPSDPAKAQPLQTDVLYQGHISAPGDIDTFSVAAPPAGNSVRVTLSHLPADYDLVVYGPNQGLPFDTSRPSPLGSSPLGSSPLGSSPVPDNSGQPIVGDTSLSPNSLQDVPLGSSPLGSSSLQVRGVSIRRGTDSEGVTIPVTESDQGSSFVIQVSGFNGAFSNQPYVLHTAVVPGPAPLACYTRSYANTGTPGTFPSLPLSNTTTALFLVDQQRMGTIYGPDKTATMLTNLQTVAAQVNGAIIPVESDSTVDVPGAFTAWDADPCSVAKANTVVSRINAVVDHVRSASGGMPQLRSIVLVGPDDAMPQARVPDLTHLSNEAQYGLDAAVTGQDTAVSRALADGFLLTDDPYGDFAPRPWLSGLLYLPDVALGRLVETPDEISSTLQEFVTFKGALNTKSAFVTGYDFMADGAQAMYNALQPAVPSGAATLRNDNAWTSQDAATGMNNTTAGFVAVNAHYNHYESLPAASFTAGNTADLFTTAQANPAPGALLFTMGCHSGLNIPDIGLTTANPAKLKDWPQAAIDKGAVYEGNTGFGYGDTDTVAYGERLLQYYSQNLAAGTMTASQALLFAKQRYLADLGVAGVYDAKVLEESTFYGLPMWKIGTGTEAGSAMPPPPATQPANVTLRTSPFSVSPTTQRVDTAHGSYWVVPGYQPEVVHFRPIEPRMSLDVTASDGLPVHGAVIEALASSDITGVNPVYDRPTIDLSAHEPEPTASAAFFPTQLQAISSLQTPSGRADRLVLMPGQFSVGNGVPSFQRLFSQMGGTVYRSDSTDWSAPVIRSVSGSVVNGGATFTVRTPDTDVARGVVLWRDDASATWHELELINLGNGVWSSGTLLTQGATKVVEFDVQLVDTSGNVGVSTNKGPGYVATTAPSGGGVLAIAVSPQPGPSGYETGPTEVTVTGTGATGSSYTVDSGTPTPYTGPFMVGGDGMHVVQVVAPDGTVAVAFVGIDTTGPVVNVTITPPANANGYRQPPVTVHFTCNDAVSGVATCPADVVLSGDGSGQTVSGTATDRVGNATTVTVTNINIDGTPPVITATTSPVANAAGWNNTAVTVHYTCTDNLSGVASCPGDQTISTEGKNQSTSGTATDNAGNTATLVVKGINIDLTKPTATINAPPLGVLTVNGMFTGTATDNLSGVSNVVVSYIAKLGGSSSTVTATRTCDAAALSCTWSAPAPKVPGTYDISAVATDNAGLNSSPAQLANIVITLT